MVVFVLSLSCSVPPRSYHIPSSQWFSTLFNIILFQIRFFFPHTFVSIFPLGFQLLSDISITVSTARATLDIDCNSLMLFSVSYRVLRSRLGSLHSPLIWMIRFYGFLAFLRRHGGTDQSHDQQGLQMESADNGVNFYRQWWYHVVLNELWTCWTSAPRFVCCLFISEKDAQIAVYIIMLSVTKSSRYHSWTWCLFLQLWL